MIILYITIYLRIWIIAGQWWRIPSISVLGRQRQVKKQCLKKKNPKNWLINKIKVAYNWVLFKILIILYIFVTWERIDKWIIYLWDIKYLKCYSIFRASTVLWKPVGPKGLWFLLLLSSQQRLRMSIVNMNFNSNNNQHE